MIKKGRIIFVNGYWMPGLIGRSIIRSQYPGKRYWLGNFEKEAEAYLDINELPDTHRYIDASSIIGIDMNGKDRYHKAFKDYDYSEEDIEEKSENNKNIIKYRKFLNLTAGMDKMKHCFYIITHSEGSAYGAGLAQLLINKGWKIELVVHLSADEANQFDTPDEPLTYQLGFTARKTPKAIAWGDWVTNNYPIRKGVNKCGIAYRKLAGIRIHNKSRCGDVFNYVKDLETVEIRPAVDNEGSKFFEQIPATTPNGTVFTVLNGIQLKYDP